VLKKLHDKDLSGVANVRQDMKDVLPGRTSYALRKRRLLCWVSLDMHDLLFRLFQILLLYVDINYSIKG